MANLLTGIRLLLAVPVAYSFAHPEFIHAGLLLALVMLGIVTDWLDGKLARALGTSSPAGQFFDHGSDCLFVSCGLAGIAWTGMIPWILPVLVVIAFSQYVLDSYFLFRQKQLRMNPLGRINGICYFVPLIAVALARLLPAAASDLAALVVLVLAWSLVLSTLASMVDRALAPWQEKRTTH
ncbi:MAG: CDP-alcohol phosphatidyltransferase family protein [Gammaproteobacteria bacterium]